MITTIVILASRYYAAVTIWYFYDKIKNEQLQLDWKTFLIGHDVEF